MRLDKLLANSGYGSRKEVKKIIRSKRVKVNDVVISNDDYKVDEDLDVVYLDGVALNYKKYLYFMLNKPQGLISATKDGRTPTVMEIFYEYESRNLFPAGRLDIDTTGLLLITNDGALAHRLLSPKHHVTKTYYVEFEGTWSSAYEEELKNGIFLEDFTTLPATASIINENTIYLSICEGKFHQVKRMMAHFGLLVTRLERVSFGPLKLDESLDYGEYRELSIEEIEELYNVGKED